MANQELDLIWKDRFNLTWKGLIIEGTDFCPYSSILIENEKDWLLKPLYLKFLFPVAVINHSAEQFVVKGKLQKKIKNTKNPLYLCLKSVDSKVFSKGKYIYCYFIINKLYSFIFFSPFRKCIPKLSPRCKVWFSGG